MKINIDFSIFSSVNDAYGNVSGVLDLAECPRVGDSLSSIFSGPSGVADATSPGCFVVETRRYDVGQEFDCSIGMSDIVVSGEIEAEKIMKHFEVEFGLCGYRYED